MGVRGRRRSSGLTRRAVWILTCAPAAKVIFAARQCLVLAAVLLLLGWHNLGRSRGPRRGNLHGTTSIWCCDRYVPRTAFLDCAVLLRCIFFFGLICAFVGSVPRACSACCQTAARCGTCVALLCRCLFLLFFLILFLLLLPLLLLTSSPLRALRSQVHRRLIVVVTSIVSGLVVAESAS